MTNTQQKNFSNVKEGKIVNAFVKDPLLSLDETLDTLVISNTKINLPEKVFDKEKKKDNGMLILAGSFLRHHGFNQRVYRYDKKFFQKKHDSTKEYLLPGITRNHCINDEVHQSIFSMIQSPNRRTILAAIGVITLGSMAFIGKNFIDGYKDVWIKNAKLIFKKLARKFN